MVTGLTRALIATRDIEIPGGGTFAVRGFSPEDAFRLYRRHAGELGNWFDKLSATHTDITLDAVPLIASSLMESAPVIGAEIIALASGELSEETTDIARQLSIGVQVGALEAIHDLTFTSEMPPKKLVEIVIRMASQVAPPSETTDSLTG